MVLEARGIKRRTWSSEYQTLKYGGKGCKRNKIEWKKIDKRGPIFNSSFYLPLVNYTKDKWLGFIFSKWSSFVNSLLHLVLCGDGVCIRKIKKNKVPWFV